MTKVFASGSCRILTTISIKNSEIKDIHSMYTYFKGTNFLGKLHNTKQHIQFIKFIRGDIDIPKHILPKFLRSYNYIPGCEDPSLNSLKLKNLRDEFDNCDVYIFEICSVKLYTLNGYQVHIGMSGLKTYTLQTNEQLIEDLKEIRDIIPYEKKIIFQCHFRPNIIYNNPNKSIKNREQIYEAIYKFCQDNINVYIYDPSVILRENNNLFDGKDHFNLNGYIKSHHYLCENYF